MAQYKKDGLSSQRYSRKTGGTGFRYFGRYLYKCDGSLPRHLRIRPKWNRMGLEPNLSEILNGTEFNYTLRDTDYRIRLSVDDYEMQTDRFSVKSRDAFGASFGKAVLVVYPHNEEKTVLKIFGESSSPMGVTLKQCSGNDISWEMNTADNYRFIIEGLNPALKYKLAIRVKRLL